MWFKVRLLIILISSLVILIWIVFEIKGYTSFGQHFIYWLDDQKIKVLYKPQDQEIKRLKNTPYKVVRDGREYNPYGVQVNPDFEQNGVYYWQFFVCGKILKAADNWVEVDTGTRIFRLYQGEKAICFEQERTPAPIIQGKEVACKATNFKPGYHAAVATLVTSREPAKAFYMYFTLTPINQELNEKP